MAPDTVLWSRTIRCSGEVLDQQRGKAFTYSVSGDTVCIDTANQNLSQRQIADASNRMPLTGPDGTTTTHSPRTTTHRPPNHARITPISSPMRSRIAGREWSHSRA